MKYLTRIIVWAIVLLIIALSGFNLYLTYELSKNTYDNKSDIQSSKTHIESIRSEINDLSNKFEDAQKTPVLMKGEKGDPGLSGSNGKDGQDSLSTHTIEKQSLHQTIIQEVPVKGEKGDTGLTPEIRCNTDRNRWEVKYIIDSSWQILNNKTVKCMVE